MKKILTAGLSAGCVEAVRQICTSIGAQWVRLDLQSMDMRLDELIKGEVTESGEEPDIGMGMVIFAGLSDRELDIYIDSYKRLGAEPIPLKAVVTATNRGWTVRRLYRELGREYMYYRMRDMAGQR